MGFHTESVESGNLHSRYLCSGMKTTIHINPSGRRLILYIYIYLYIDLCKDAIITKLATAADLKPPCRRTWWCWAAWGGSMAAVREGWPHSCPVAFLCRTTGQEDPNSSSLCSRPKKTWRYSTRWTERTSERTATQYCEKSQTFLNIFWASS